MALKEIKVKLHSAKDVKKPSLFSKVYPVAVVSLPGLNRVTSQTQRPSRADDDPKWDESFKFKVPADRLQPGVFAKIDVYGDSDLKWFCGSTNVPLVGVTEEDRKYPLVDEKGGAHGYVKVSIKVSSAAQDSAGYSSAPTSSAHAASPYPPAPHPAHAAHSAPPAPSPTHSSTPPYAPPPAHAPPPAAAYPTPPPAHAAYPPHAAAPSAAQPPPQAYPHAYSYPPPAQAYPPPPGQYSHAPPSYGHYPPPPHYHQPPPPAYGGYPSHGVQHSYSMPHGSSSHGHGSHGYGHHGHHGHHHGRHRHGHGEGMGEMMAAGALGFVGGMIAGEMIEDAFDGE